MRKSYSDVGWLVTEDGRMAGLSLGYDRCAEHEWGIQGLLDEFGVALPEVPVGVEDRQVQAVPAQLHFVEYKAEPRDKRRKRYPAAFMLLSWRVDEAPTTPPGDVAFWLDPGDKRGREEDDLQCAWSRDAFCVNVRGEQGIERLKALYAAFQRKDVAIALPWAKSFFKGGLSFAIVSAMTDDERTSVRERDLGHKKLVDAAKATGVYDALKAAGLRWHALSPDWVDREVQTDLAFFLNPWEQAKYNFGWFTTAELLEWADGKGPVIRYAELDAFAKRPENRDWSYRLVKGMGEKAAHLRFGAHLVWFDEERSIPGLKVMASKSTAPDVLASGTYRFDDLMERFASPLEVQVAQSTPQPA